MTKYVEYAEPQFKVIYSNGMDVLTASPVDGVDDFNTGELMPMTSLEDRGGLSISG